MKIKISHILLNCDTRKKMAHIFAHLLILVQKTTIQKDCQQKTWKINQGRDTVWQRLSQRMYPRRSRAAACVWLSLRKSYKPKILLRS